ncbi:glutamate receptor ionotropic, delta-2-like [Centruroides sculpturatus]|uniref:glutamate receptor ionotropic, delta-2-like n=2 Tax=Centruroides sculpturatus TaxID=218467 RepID=UPI000C6E8B77|nr:glutamate receptor ionotropic, delta-2-like [Centruroides sculpturatus]
MFDNQPSINLNGSLLKVASMTREPYQKVNCCMKKCTGEGFSFEIINKMAEYFNFTYEIIIPIHKVYGSKLPNGTWIGIIGMLANNEADIAAIPLTVIQERKEVAVFSTTLFKDSINILMKQPSASGNAGALLSPFNLYVWIILIVFSILMGPLVYLLQHIHYKLIIVEEEPDKRNDYKLIECFWFVYSALIRQGSELNPSYDSTRILFAAWWLFTLVITTFYTANLTAFLSLETYAVEKDLHGILDHTDKKWIARNGSALYINTLKGEEPIFSILKKSLNENRGLFLTEDNKILQLVLEKDYVFLQNSFALNFIAQRELMKHNKCMFVTTGFKFFKNSYSFAFSKTNKYINEFNHFFQLITRTGLLSKWIIQHLIPAHTCTLSSATGYNSFELALSLRDIIGAFIVYLIGMAVSIVAFLMEKIWKREK